MFGTTFAYAFLLERTMSPFRPFPSGREYKSSIRTAVEVIKAQLAREQLQCDPQYRIIVFGCLVNAL
jgi:hypothetical protein